MRRPDPDITTMLARLREQFATTRTALKNTPTADPEWITHQHAYCDELYAQVMALEWVIYQRPTLPVVEVAGRTGETGADG